MAGFGRSASGGRQSCCCLPHIMQRCPPNGSRSHRGLTDTLRHSSPSSQSSSLRHGRWHPPRNAGSSLSQPTLNRFIPSGHPDADSAVGVEEQDISIQGETRQMTTKSARVTDTSLAHEAPSSSSARLSPGVIDGTEERRRCARRATPPPRDRPSKTDRAPHQIAFGCVMPSHRLAPTSATGYGAPCAGHSPP